MWISTDGDSDGTRLADIGGEVLKDVRESGRRNVARLISGSVSWLLWQRGNDVNTTTGARISCSVPRHDTVITGVFQHHFVNLQRRSVGSHRHLPTRTITSA